jgi:putative oxidoreductase
VTLISDLLRTNSDIALTIVRVVLGVVFFAHGAQKALGWFGGYGFAGTVKSFKEQMGVPPPLATLAIAAEFLGGMGLVLGLLGRIAALGIAATMLVAILKVNGRFGLFLDWFGNQKGHGIEFHLLALAISVAIILDGSGPLSLDALLSGTNL